MDTNPRSVRAYKRGPYKRHPAAFKRAVVEASFAPGASVSRVARDHDINANQVFLWRKLYQDDLLLVAYELCDPVPEGNIAHFVDVLRSADALIVADSAVLAYAHRVHPRLRLHLPLHLPLPLQQRAWPNRHRARCNPPAPRHITAKPRALPAP